MWLITNMGTASRNTNIHLLSVQQKVDHKIVFPASRFNNTHRDFRLLLVRKLTEEAEKSQDHPNSRLVVTSVGAKMFCDSRVTITITGQQNHQPNALLCASLSQRKGTVYKCTRCDVGLFKVPCFVEYHTKVNL